MGSDQSTEDCQPSHQVDLVTQERAEATQLVGELHLNGTTAKPITWSDAIFTEKFLPMAKVSDKVTIADAIPAAKALLNWYVLGIKPTYSSDAILFVFYAMNMRNYGINVKIFPSILMQGETPLKKPNEPEKIEEIEYQSPIRFEFKPNKFSSLPPVMKKKATVPGPVNFVEKTVKEWYTILWEALDQNLENMNQMGGKKQQQAINLIGFLYMNLQRLTKRNQREVCEHLTSRVFDEFSDIWCVTDDEMIVKRIIPPTSKMVSDFVNDYKQFSTNSMRCLASIVAAFGNAHENQDLFLIRKVLNAGCLNVLYQVNLGIVRLIKKAHKTNRILTLSNVVECMSVKETHYETNMALLDLFKCISNKEYSCYWARMFSNEAFPKLDVKENPEYAMTMFSVFIRNNPKRRMWKSWVRFDSTGKTQQAALQMGRDLNSKISILLNKRRELVR